MDCFTPRTFIPTNKNIIPIPGLTTFVAKTADASALQVAVKRYPTYDAIYAVATSQQYVSAGNFGLVISRSIDGANTWSTPIAATNPEFYQFILSLIKQLQY